MAVKLITGLKTTADIESQDDGARIYGTVSSGDRVLNVGTKWAYQTISNNCIRIKDGEALMQGRHVRQAPSTYTDVTINNGESGKKRYDIIVLRYTKAVGTGIENVELAVVEGTPATSSPTIPSLTTGNIFTGCTTHEMGLYRVYINGLNISSVTKLFTEVNSMENSYSSLNTSYTNLNTKVNGMATTAAITYYISPSGSNSNSGTSSSYPFKTLKYALDKLPKRLDHDVTINVAAGTYTESTVCISGFFGLGRLKINGAGDNTANAINYKFSNGMLVEKNACSVHLAGLGFDAINYKRGVYTTENPGFIFVTHCQVVNSTSSQISDEEGSVGVYVERNSTVWINESKINHCNAGVSSHEISKMLVNNCSMENCNSGVWGHGGTCIFCWELSFPGTTSFFRRNNSAVIVEQGGAFLNG